MNRNEKIIDLLEKNGFEKDRFDYIKIVKIRNRYSKVGDVKINAYVYLDDEMENSNVDFEIECSVDGDTSDMKIVSEELSYICDDIDDLEDEIKELGLFEGEEE